MVLAEKFNSAAGSRDAALRMVMDIVERAEGQDGERAVTSLEVSPRSPRRGRLPHPGTRRRDG